jgi:hypothetical protein
MPFPKESSDPAANELLQHSLASSAAYFDNLQDELEKRLLAKHKAGAPLSDLLDTVSEVLREHTDSLATVLADAEMAAYVQGAAKVIEDVVGKVPGLVEKLEEAVPIAGEAIEWQGMRSWMPLIRKAVESLQEKRLVSRAQFDQLANDAKQRAFTVAGQRTEQAIAKVREAVVEAVETGSGLREFQDKVAEAAETSPIAPVHAEVVFRNNVNRAYGEGMDRILDDPIVGNGFPFEANSIIDDSRVTDLCRVFNKSGIAKTNIFLRADPVYQAYKAPRHHGCRCSRIPMSIEDAARRGLAYAREWIKSGVQPQPPAYVPTPSVTLPPGWVSP